MFRLGQQETKRLVLVHGWCGTLLGLLLYAVIVTGTAAVFAREINAWSAGKPGLPDALARPVDDLVQRLEAEVPEAYRSDLSLRATPNGHVALFFHTDEKTPSGETKARGVLFTVAPDDRILSRVEGFASDLFVSDAATALGRFFIDLHVRLHLPKPWGLLLTGVLGLGMLVAAVSGLLMHRHLLRDIFTLRNDTGRLVGFRDLHTVAATWTLPHAFILAFTGAFFSFALSIGLPTLARIAFSGDQPGLIAALIGERVVPNPAAAASGSLDRILAQARMRAAAPLLSVSIENRGRADATVLTRHYPKAGELGFQSFVFDGATGAFLKDKPILGSRPSLGAEAYMVMRGLHFGDFAGWISKAVWFALGTASAYVVWSGLRLWLRRRDAHVGWRVFGRLAAWIGGGLPLSMAAAAAAYFCALRWGDPNAWIPVAFVACAAAAGLVAATAPPQATERTLWGATGLLLLLLPVLRIVSGGAGWIESLSGGHVATVAMDGMMLLGAFGCLAPPLLHLIKPPRRLHFAEAGE